MSGVPLLVILAVSLAVFLFLQPSNVDRSWSRLSAFYHQRAEQAGIVGSGLMFGESGR